MEAEKAFNLPHGSIRAILILLPLIALVILAVNLKSQLLIGGLLSLVSTGFGFYFGNKNKEVK